MKKIRRWDGIVRNDIIKMLEQELKEKCEGPSNFFGYGIYYHVCAVVKNAVLLAQKYGGDEEVVAIAAWLHDYASITDYKYYKEHHLHGADMAEKRLKVMDYPALKIELVQKCILNHRGSVVGYKSTIEEICVADGDAISHFDSVPSLLYLAYVKRGYSIADGIDFVANKLKRSFNKLSDESKVIYNEKYNSVLKMLSGE